MANITFVDNKDEVIGYGNRSEAIEKGLAHRISRVFVFNSHDELLIQKRSPKIKLPGKWDQSAAGHVDEGEDYPTAAAREAKEEIGLQGIELTEFGKFYTEEVDEGIVKKRFNMLYVAHFDGKLMQDNDEVSEIKWISLKELEKWMADTPDDFTQGFLLTYSYYTKLMDVKNILERNYSLGSVIEVTRLKSGVSNENYKVVTSTGGFIARICHFEPLNQINVMIPFLEYAASIDYHAPRLVKTKDDHSYFGSESEPVIVTTIVNGTPGAYDAINIEQLNSLGSALAQLHKLPWSPEQTSKTNNTTYTLNVYQQFSNAQIESNEKNESFLDILEQDYDHFANDTVQHQLHNLPTGLIHNDVIPDNVLFDGNKVTSFVDLEEIGQGIMLLDIARVINSWCFVDNQPQPDRIAAFLKSYNLGRTFMPSELEALPVVMHFVSFRNSVFGLKMLAQKRISSINDSKDYAHLLYIRQNQRNLTNITSTLALKQLR